jgi:predicted transposase YbfD/YdcC
MPTRTILSLSRTSRRTHDKRKGIEALHTLSAYATNARLVLGQLSVPKKTNEITAIPELLDHLAETKQLGGALVIIVKVFSHTEYADQCSFETRYYISSPALDILANGVRGHWGVESMHWLLDVEFKDDLSRYRTGNGAKNMAIVRRFAIGLIRANKCKGKGSVKTRRKSAGWNTDYLVEALKCCSSNER